MLLFFLLLPEGFVASSVSNVLRCSCCSSLSNVFATGDDGRDCCKGDVRSSFSSSLKDIDDVLIFLLLTYISIDVDIIVK